MKEALFILLVIGVLAALTAIRYRKQITGMIGIAKVLKDATKTIATGPKNIPGDTNKSIPLVNCSKCGIWVPQSKAIRVRDAYYCSDDCRALSVN